MKVTKRIEGDYEHMNVERVISPTGTASDKVQELIDVYLETGEGDVPAVEVVDNLKKLKRIIERIDATIEQT